MTPEEFKKRTKAFSLNIIELAESFPRNKTTDIIGSQLLRVGTSTGANYRAACRTQSRAHFISKLGDVEEEIDESIYWMELLVESVHVTNERVEPLIREADGY
jgi:four helix bundle protein